MGKTTEAGGDFYCEKKHPHGRGEDENLYCAKCAEEETPPRAWGRRNGGEVDNGTGRNTPTGVGKTFLHISNTIKFWKHPHGRGEDSASSGYTSFLSETPPRAWGRRICLNWIFYTRGNTPTGVGKTNLTFFFLYAPQKHPHGRGEDKRPRRCRNS